MSVKGHVWIAVRANLLLTNRMTDVVFRIFRNDRSRMIAFGASEYVSAAAQKPRHDESFRILQDHDYLGIFDRR